MKSKQMNRWLTLGANIGVLIGIMLLVVELDQNREMIRAQTRNDISRQISDHLGMVANNSQLSSLKRRADAGEELSADEEQQQFLLFTANKRLWENIHYQYRHGMFEEEEFEAERTAWRYLINKDKSFVRNWCPTRKNYSPEFVAELESLLNEDVCAVAQATRTADDDCESVGEFGFVCGPQNAEDLVRIPDTKWIIASGMAPGAAIYLIDSQQKSWVELYPGASPQVEHDKQTYGACPGSPDPDTLVTHGLNLRPGVNGHSTLYVVGHGGREAIEVFDVNIDGATPVLTWTGCVMTPDGMQANSVASFSDGSLVATIPLHTGIPISAALAGEITGAVYEWSPGDSGFAAIPGTELPYANGIEVSADEREIYVASSGLLTVIAYSNSNPARKLRSTDELAFIPDNLHADDDGNLITAGLNVIDPDCGDVVRSHEFSLEEYAACPRPFTVLAIDPKSMQGKIPVSGPAIEQFSNITMALPVGHEIWIGTFAGDRIAYHSLP